ncbi:hypothetical protein Tco_1201435 [Tanacetum coccineum]
MPAAVSPIADSPGYITESEPEEDPEEDDEDPEEDPADYPTDRDDDEEEEEEDPSGDNAGDKKEDEDADEEEEHLALADSVDRFLVISTPPPLPHTSYSSPLPQIPSPPLPVPSPLHVSPPPLPASPTYPLGYIAAMIRFRAESPSTSYPLPLPSPITPPSGTPPLLPITLPTSSPPLLLSFTVCREGVSEVTLRPQKRLCITLSLRFEVGESSSAPTARPTREFRRDYGFVATLDDEIRCDLERDVGYRITDTWDEMVEYIQGIPTATDVTGLSQRMTDFVSTVRQDTYEIYGKLDDAKDDRSLMRDSDGSATESKMAPKRTTISTPATTTTPTTYVTDKELKRLIDQGVADALVAREATKSGNGEDSHDSGMGVRRQAPLAHEMETVFRISNYSMENQIKFSTCTLLRSALTWWNSHVKTVSHDVAYAMMWTNLKKNMIDKYCPRGEELALMCARMFPEESKKIEKYLGGLPDMIHGSVIASKPKTMHDAIEFATEMMCKKICTFAKRHSENKRKQDDNQQQQQNKRQNTGRAYAAGSGEKKPYGDLNLCAQNATITMTVSVL